VDYTGLMHTKEKLWDISTMAITEIAFAVSEM
jgi:hypothetical protein